MPDSSAEVWRGRTAYGPHLVRVVDTRIWRTDGFLQEAPLLRPGGRAGRSYRLSLSYPRVLVTEVRGLLALYARGEQHVELLRQAEVPVLPAGRQEAEAVVLDWQRRLHGPVGEPVRVADPVGRSTGLALQPMGLALALGVVSPRRLRPVVSEPKAPVGQAG
ncbi:hypothetical protein ACFYMW_36020 [Streptomyces sp. NPDC006692]|uniref:hypothetical protein n=1 Tax=unclassified Streptomyces TaxID=2593676 RepID=UPI0034437B88